MRQLQAWRMASVLIAVMLMAVLAFSIAQVQARPYFTTVTPDKIVGVIVPDSDCFHEFYARATPKNNNHVLLNKETIPNNDRPDAGPGEAHKFVWYYDIRKMIQTTATNEGKIRTYVTIELTDSITGMTVTKYLHLDTGNHRLDFGIFNLKTDKSLCQ